MRTIPALAVILALAFVGLVAQEGRVPETAGLQRLEKMTARFAPTSIQADLSHVSAADRQVLAKLVEAEIAG